MWQEIVDFFFPKTCVGCGKMEVDLCESCVDELAISGQICPMCGKESILGWTHFKCKKKFGLDGLTAIYQYQDVTTRKVIDSIKYDFNQNLVESILQNFVFENGQDFDMVVPVPLYYYRENWRGFNQAELIGKMVAEKMELNCERILRRTKNTKQQALMKTRKERFENIEAVFEVNKELNSFDINNKKILLVDDVFTSGANMRECTKILKKNGAEFVWGLALAH